ncbi:MAG: hypothetical protein IJB69_05765 [Clostridia bacterium]|nr:hypothetical protein [Clostridia bacterium]
MYRRLIAVSLLLCLFCSAAMAEVHTLPDGRNVILAVGGSFAYTRDTTGFIRCWGDNQFGQLGKGNLKQTYKVSDFKTKNEEIDLSLLQEVVTASDYSYLWLSDGTLWGVGNNSYLPLALKEGTYTTHKKVNVPEVPAAMATGFGHVLMLTEEGKVYAWGRNNNGQVGNGKRRNVQEPYLLPLENIVQIAGGGKFSLALAADGTLYGWGNNENHEISPENTAYFAEPIVIDYGDISIASIDACGHSVVLLDKEGTLWTWGRNDFHQLGYDTGLKTTASPQAIPLPLPVKYVAAYSSQTYAILEDGSLWSWGNNSYGQLGQGFRSSASEGVLPAQVWDKDVVLVQGGSLFCLAMLSDGTVLSAGISKFGQQGEGTADSKYALSPNGMDLILDE